MTDLTAKIAEAVTRWLNQFDPPPEITFTQSFALQQEVRALVEAEATKKRIAIRQRDEAWEAMRRYERRVMEQASILDRRGDRSNEVASLYSASHEARRALPDCPTCGGSGEVKPKAHPAFRTPIFNEPCPNPSCPHRKEHET